MKKIHIVIIQPIQSPYWTERLKVLAQHEDLEVTLLLERRSFAHRPGWQPESINGIKIKVLDSVVLPATSVGDDLGYRIQGVRSVPWRLVIAIWQLRPDVVVLCNATQILLSLLLKPILGYRIALIVEDTPHAIRNLGRFSRWVKSWAYHRADCWFAFSDDAKAYLEQIGIVKGVERSSWSLDMKRFTPPVAHKSASSNIANDKPQMKILFVGALIINKGIHLLLEAWRCLPSDIRRRSSLYIAGSGPLKNKLEIFVREHHLKEVEFLGQVPYSTVHDLFRNSDLFILPTLQDLFSLTVLEAMASGCPVITTPFNGARELVDENNGWLVDPTNPDALKSILEKALSGDVDLRKMGLEARKRVEHMDNKIVMDKFANSLRKLATTK